MNKVLEKLALIQKVFEKLADWNGYDLSKLDKDFETTFDLDFVEIEKALKQAEENEKLLNVFKNALSYEVKNDSPFVADMSKDSLDYLMKTIIEVKTHELDDELKKLLRDWVLKNAFPKELKALEVIKENLNLEEILLALKGSCKASDYDLAKEVLL